MRSKYRLGPTYLFLLGEIHAHTRARVRAGRRGCMRVSAKSRYSQSPRPDDSRLRNGNEVSEEPEGKVAGDLRGVQALMSEMRRRTETTRRKDTRMNALGESPVVLTQVHQVTGDPVTNSPTFCPIPTAVLLTHYKAHRATCYANYIIVI